MLTGDKRDYKDKNIRLMLAGSGTEDHSQKMTGDVMDDADFILYDSASGIGAFACTSDERLEPGKDDCTPGIHVVDAHLRDDGTCGIDFVALTEAEGILIFIPGRGSLAVISGGLLSAGMDPDTPAYIIETGQSGPGRNISTTLSELRSAARESKALLPAIIVIGECTPYDYDISDDPGDQSDSETAASMADIIKDLRNSRFEWIVFTDPESVSLFMNNLLEKCDIRVLAYSRIAAVGEGAQSELRKYGIRADVVTKEAGYRTQESQITVHLRKGDRVLIIGDKDTCSAFEEEMKLVRGVELFLHPVC